MINNKYNSSVAYGARGEKLTVVTGKDGIKKVFRQKSQLRAVWDAKQKKVVYK